MVNHEKLVYIFKDSWKFFINPIYFILKHACNYTSMFPFFSNVVFWHLMPLLVFRLPFIFHEVKVNAQALCLVNAVLIVFIFFETLRVKSDEQFLTDIKFGLIGVVSCLFILLMSVFAIGHVNSTVSTSLNCSIILRFTDLVLHLSSYHLNHFLFYGRICQLFFRFLHTTTI